MGPGRQGPLSKKRDLLTGGLRRGIDAAMRGFLSLPRVLGRVLFTVFPKTRETGAISGRPNIPHVRLPVVGL